MLLLTLVGIASSVHLVKEHLGLPQTGDAKSNLESFLEDQPHLVLIAGANETETDNETQEQSYLVVPGQIAELTDLILMLGELGFPAIFDQSSASMVVRVPMNVISYVLDQIRGLGSSRVMKLNVNEPMLNYNK